MVLVGPLVSPVLFDLLYLTSFNFILLYLKLIVDSVLQVSFVEVPVDHNSDTKGTAATAALR